MCGDFGISTVTQSPVSFSTSPFAPATHWKQTVFLLQKPIQMVEGKKLEGKISVQKDKNDPRALRVRFLLGDLKFFYRIC